MRLPYAGAAPAGRRGRRLRRRVLPFGGLHTQHQATITVGDVHRDYWLDFPNLGDWAALTDPGPSAYEVAGSTEVLRMSVRAHRHANKPLARFNAWIGASL